MVNLTDGEGVGGGLTRSVAESAERKAAIGGQLVGKSEAVEVAQKGAGSHHPEAGE